MITLKVSGLNDLASFIRHAEKARDELEQLEKPLKKVKEKQITRWAKNFTSQGGIYGKWETLSDEWTIPERQEQGYGAGPILVRNGTLLAHFVEQNDEGIVSNDAINWEMSNKGSSRGYAAATVSHHRGYPNPLPNRKAIPSRKLWDFDEEDIDNAEKILEKYVDSILKKYF